MPTDNTGCIATGTHIRPPVDSTLSLVVVCALLALLSACADLAQSSPMQSSGSGVSLAPWVLAQVPDPSSEIIHISVMVGGCYVGPIEGVQGVGRLSEVSVKEGPDVIEVGAWVEHSSVQGISECGDIGVEFETEVNLGSPLGDRRLVDVSCRVEENRIRFERCRDEEG